MLFVIGSGLYTETYTETGQDTEKQLKLEQL